MDYDALCTDSIKELKPILIRKSCGYRTLRWFSETLSFQQVWDMIRVEFPYEKYWYVIGDRLELISLEWSVVSQGWQQALRQMKGRPMFPLPHPVVYGLQIHH
jgi:hypothetical protein